MQIQFAARNLECLNGKAGGTYNDRCAFKGVSLVILQFACRLSNWSLSTATEIGKTKKFLLSYTGTRFGLSPSGNNKKSTSERNGNNGLQSFYFCSATYTAQGYIRDPNASVRQSLLRSQISPRGVRLHRVSWCLLHDACSGRYRQLSKRAVPITVNLATGESATVCERCNVTPRFADP
jgi:hypothetical protein